MKKSKDAPMTGAQTWSAIGMGAFHSRMTARHLQKAIEGCQVHGVTEALPLLDDAQKKSHVMAKALEEILTPEGKRLLERALKKSRYEV